MEKSRPSRPWLAPLLAVTALLAVALAAVAIVLASKNATLNSDVHRLSSDLARVSRNVHATGRQVEALSVPQKTVSPVRVTKLDRRLKLIEDCVPELQAEVNSLSWEDGYISIDQQVSRRCSPSLYGTPAAGGDE